MRGCCLYAIVHSSCLAGLFAVVLVAAVPGKAIGGSNPQYAKGEKKVERLLAVIRDKKVRESDPNRVVEAIQELGRQKAVAAVNDLVDLLTFKRSWPWESTGGPIDEIHTITPGGRYPAVGALMEIGKPSLAAVVRAIADHGVDTLQGANALEVVRFLFRDRPSAGVDHLNEAAAEASAPEVAQRLLKAAEVLKESKR